MILKRILDKIFGFGYYQYERLIVMNRKELRKYFERISKKPDTTFASMGQSDRAISEIRKLLSQKYNIEIEIICYNTFVSDKGHLNKRYSCEVRILGINLREPDYSNRERLFDLYTESDFHSYAAAEYDAVDKALKYLAFDDKWDSRYAFGNGQDAMIHK